MNKWEMLGIEPTKDIKLIKRAYASKLKIYHPEEDPEGYQALREAYDWAVEQSKKLETIVIRETIERVVPRDSFSVGFGEWEINIEEDETDGESVEPIYSVEDDYDKYDAENQDENENKDSLEESLTTPPRLVYDLNLVDSDLYEQVSLFMEKVEKLYDDFPKRINESCWLELLQDSVMWNISVSEDLNEEVSDFFEENYFLPSGVWKLLNQSFNWTSKYNQDPDEFKECFSEIYRRVIRYSPECLLSYDGLIHAEDIDYDSYLSYREDACIALVEQRLEDAKDAILYAQEIFADDPALARLICQYCRLAEDFAWGLEISEHSIQRYPDMKDMFLHRAYFYYCSGKIPKALHDAQTILLSEPNHASAMSLALRCYMEQEQLDKAEDMGKRLLALTSNDIEAVSAIAIINQRKLDSLPWNNKQRKALITLTGGGMPFKQRMREVVQTVRFRWIFVIIALVIQLIVINGVTNDLGMSLSEYLRSDFNKQHNVQTITNSDEMQIAFNYGTPIELTLTKSRYMGLNRVYEKNSEQFMKTQEAKDRKLFKSGAGYVSIGYLGDKTVLVVTDYEQSKKIYHNGEVTVVGHLKPLTGSNLDEALGTWASGRTGELRNAAYVLGHPVTAFYVDTQEEIKSGLQKIGLKWLPYIAVLAWLYLCILKEMIRIWRWLRYV